MRFLRSSAMPPTWALTFLSLYAVRAHASDSNNSASQIRPYTIDVDPAFIEQTRIKADAFRPSLDINAPAWFDGPSTEDITTFAKYWTESYDWFAVQSQINANFSHYITTIPPPGGNYNDSLDVHFIHQRSDRDDAIPLLMLHGWPSTSLEWEKVIPDLVDPADSSKPAFHIVAPDFPGFGFSPAPTAPGLGPSEHSTVVASLMQQLGYERYAVYSTDLGYVVALKMIAEHEMRIINHITDFYIVSPNDTDRARYAANQTTPEETAYIASMNVWFANHSAYSSIHSTFPLAIAHALNDSPIGFLGWMYHLVFSVSDQMYTPSELITQSLLLYIPGVYGNIRSYKELFFSLATNSPGQSSSVPTSVLQFGGVGNGVYPEISNFNYVPRDWIERTANLTYFARHDAGGHFPALSQPGLVIEDIRAIFT